MNKAIYTPAYRAMIGRLRLRRASLGLSQWDVARKLGVHRTWISRVEMCELTLTAVALIWICRAYGLSAAKMLQRLEHELAEGDEPPYLSVARVYVCLYMGPIPARRAAFV